MRETPLPDGLLRDSRSRLKAGCSHDWPPYDSDVDFGERRPESLHYFSGDIGEAEVAAGVAIVVVALAIAKRAFETVVAAILD